MQRARYSAPLTAVLFGLLCAAAYWIAFLLRFEFEIPEWDQELYWASLPVVLIFQLAFFGLAGHFRCGWGHVTFADLVSLGGAALAGSLCLAVANQLNLLPGFVPRAVLVLDFAGTVLLIGTVQSLGRLIRETTMWLRRNSCHRALLVGATDAEKILALYLHAQSKLPYRICGFLDTGAISHRRYVGRLPVLGQVADLAEIAQKHQVVEIIVIAGTLAGGELRWIREQCTTRNLNLRILPPLPELVRADGQIPVRQVDLNALLHREPIRDDVTGARQLIADSVVMVTGAGGSIGSELCRQILKHQPSVLVLVDRAEPSLYEIDRELRERCGATRIAACLGDVTDPGRMRRLFQLYRPQAVFHAAAHKHVPLLETHAGEAIKNNLFGAANLAELAHECGASYVVYISTDKAVKPACVMGVTKRLAENYIGAMAAESATRFLTVRFGNVLGSAGSVVPLFQEQIRRGGPLTITHPEMTRYFMTIPEAAYLVLQAAVLGKGGEVFVLDMGDPIRIVDLARDLVVMSGLPEHAVEINYCGPRPGEKLVEELYFDDECRVPTRHPKVNAVCSTPVSLSMMREYVDDLKSLVDGDDGPLFDKLREMVPEFAPPAGPVNENTHRVRSVNFAISPATGT